MQARSPCAASRIAAGQFAPSDHRTFGLPVADKAEISEVLREQRERGHVVDGDREEALDLARVQIHGQHTVDAGHLQHVRK